MPVELAAKYKRWERYKDEIVAMNKVPELENLKRKATPTEEHKKKYEAQFNIAQRAIWLYQISRQKSFAAKNPMERQNACLFTDPGVEENAHTYWTSIEKEYHLVGESFDKDFRQFLEHLKDKDFQFETTEVDMPKYHVGSK